MKRTTFRDVRLPIMHGSEEVDLRAYSYGKTTAIPHLELFVIEPFGTALKEKAFNDAVKAVGLDENGLLKASYSTEQLLDGKKFLVNASRTTRVSYDAVLSKTRSLLENIVSDNRRGIRQDDVLKGERDVYVLLNYLMSEMNSYVQANSTPFNKKDLSSIDPETGKKAVLVSDIDSVRVYLDASRYAQATDHNAQEFHRAKSLKSRIAAFMAEYEKSLMKYAPSFDELKQMEQGYAIDYELDDSSAVRYLFFTKQAPKYGDMFSGLTGKETEKITQKTGDLDVLNELGLENYEFMRGANGIIVATAVRHGEGETSITRTAKDKRDERIYNVMQKSDRIYAGAESIIKNMDMLYDLHTSWMNTQLKIDLFPSPPEYLR